MLISFLLAHAFAYCSGNPIFDATNGNVVEFQQPVEMVIVAHDWVDGWVEVIPTAPNMYRTFFLQRDHLAKKIRIRGETNWVYGEVPPTIRVAHPMHLAKIRAGTLF